jgi:hypothetical protein
VYWPVESIRARFEAVCELDGRDAAEVVADLTGPTVELEQFWQSVKTNLQAGRIRMVFLADAIPTELRRVVEFLNSQMDPAEVIAVEVKQYTGQSVKALVPRVLGQTAEAARNKPSLSAPAERWNEHRFFQALTERRGAATAAVARKILDWGVDRQLYIWWGKGAQDGSFFPMLILGAETHWIVSVWTYGRLEVQFQMMRSKPPFSDTALRRQLLSRLNTIPGVQFGDDVLERRPSIQLSVLESDGALSQLLEILDWVIEQDRQTALPPPPNP